MKKSLLKLFTGIMSFVVFLAGATSLALASCTPSNPGGCEEDENKCADGWNKADCIMMQKDKYLDHYKSTQFGPLVEACENIPGAKWKQEDDPSNSSYTFVICYYDKSFSKPYPDSEESPVRICSCRASEGQTNVNAAAEELGLEGISLEGIFSGDLTLDEIIQIILLLVYGILTVVLLVLIILNAIKLSGSGDDEQKKKAAMTGFKNVFLGAGIMLSSFLILSIFFTFFGLSPFKEVIPVECDGLSGEALDRCISNVKGED